MYAACTWVTHVVLSPIRSGSGHGELSRPPYFAITFIGKETSVLQQGLWFGDGYHPCNMLQATSQDLFCSNYTTPHTETGSEPVAGIAATMVVHANNEASHPHKRPAAVKRSSKRNKAMLRLKPTHIFFPLVLTEISSPVTSATSVFKPVNCSSQTQTASNAPNPALCRTKDATYMEEQCDNNIQCTYVKNRKDAKKTKH